MSVFLKQSRLFSWITAIRILEVQNFICLKITRKTFDKNLANIAPCSSAKYDDTNQADASSVRLHPTHGFIWERETLDTTPNVEDLNSLVLGNDEDGHHI
ncbi:hypothetical protein MTR_6g472150 [Medicago truncatula]|uniref:Uncharacterized protein n=1 Tax=Medicago truncatula TaxID=3880 RepID=A0A072UCD2_MEDTR|nr:hypothetical protein MTR_6g472150 [Medicago truncatula]